MAKFAVGSIDVYINSGTALPCGRLLKGGDMEGHIGEDEEWVWVLRQLLQPGDVVRTSERKVDQQAGEEIWIRICPTHDQFIFEFISLISILDLDVYKYRIYIWIHPTWTQFHAGSIGSSHT